MSNEKFTQGEWMVVSTGVHWNNPKLQNLQICYSDDGECVCDTVYEKTDAHLISAAPDIYRALKAVSNTIDNTPNPFGGDIDVSLTESEVAAIRTALAKAGGEE